MSKNPIDQRIGARLKNVRESLRLTLQTVSQNVGFNTYQTLGSIEKGTRPAKASELARLCELYCKDSWFFLREDEPPMQTFNCAWRNSQEAGDRPLVEAQVYDLARSYQLLEEVTGEKRMPSLVPWPQEDDLTYKSVAEKASDLVHDWNLGARPANSLREILEERFHVKIVSYNLRNAGSALTAEGDFGDIIVLNTMEVYWRQNFSLAHEVFHLLSRNHFPLIEIHLEDTNGLSDKPEYEKLADSFASALLMPDREIHSEFKKRLVDNNKIAWIDLAGIATEFGVSTQALLWRLKRLGKFKTEQVEHLLATPRFRDIDKSIRTGKKGSGLEFSRRMVRLGVKALQLGKISKGKFCEIFRTTRAAFSSFILDYGDLVYDENNADALVDPIELISPDNNNEGRAMA